MSWHRGGETVKLFPVEWTVEDEGLLTHVETTYRTEDGRKVIVRSECPKRDGSARHERLVREELAEQLSHVQVTYPE